MGKGLRTFDSRQTPSCVGKITEIFRSLPGVVRSLHPTHSVAAIGPRAAWVVAGHEDAATPCGDATPYVKVIEAGGQILFLGCRLDRNTAFHSIEALANVPYLMRPDLETFELIDAQGHKIERTLRRHQERIPRRFAEIEPELAQSGALLRGTIGSAPSLLVDSRAMRDLLVPILERDPNYLLPPTQTH
jgi:aminoglycoside 3-N-acetyltransferase